MSPMTVATAANISAKALILLDGGPGRTRTSNQAVMSAVPSPENPINIGVFGHVLRRPFAFGCGVLLVIHWLAQPPSHDGLQRK